MWLRVKWGLLYGISNCVYKAWKEWRKKNFADKDNPVARGIRILCTFLIVSLFWVMFRASNFHNALAVYKRMFIFHDGIIQPYTWSFFAFICLIAASWIAAARAKKNHEDRVNGFYPVMDLSKFLPLVLFFTFIGLTIMLGYFGNNVFIYGTF